MQHSIDELIAGTLDGMENSSQSPNVTTKSVEAKLLDSLTRLTRPLDSKHSSFLDKGSEVLLEQLDKDLNNCDSEALINQLRSELPQDMQKSFEEIEACLLKSDNDSMSKLFNLMFKMIEE